MFIKYLKKTSKSCALILAMAVTLSSLPQAESIHLLSQVYASETETDSSQNSGSSNNDSNSGSGDNKDNDSNNDNNNDKDNSNNNNPSGNSKPVQIVKKKAVISGYSNYNYQYYSGRSFYLNQKSSSNGRLSYQSSNPAVAMVDASGRVITRGVGSCVITVTSSATSTYYAASKKINLLVWKRASKLGYSKSYKKSKYYRKLFSLKLSNNNRNNLLSIATSQLGYHESSSRNSLSGSSKSSGNYTEYGRYYKNNGVPWCAIFIIWVARESGISYAVLPKECAVRYYYAFFKKKKQAYVWNQVRSKKYRPQKGDIIFYSYDYRDTTHHIGYVESCYYSGNKIIITTIEGNQKNAVRRVKLTLRTNNKTGRIAGRYITGFASPKY